MTATAKRQPKRRSPDILAGSLLYQVHCSDYSLDLYYTCLVSFYGVLDMSTELSSVSNEADREKLLKRYSPVQALESLVASGGNSPPVFIARAGKDSASINNGIDHFTSAALRLNVALSVMNYADGDHGFDGFNDTSQSRAIIAAALRFVQEQTAAR